MRNIWILTRAEIILLMASVMLMAGGAIWATAVG